MCSGQNIAQQQDGMDRYSSSPAGRSMGGVDATELNERNGEASKDDLFTDLAVHRVDGCWVLLYVNVILVVVE